MWVSEKRRSAMAARAAELLPAGVQVRGYLIGRGHVRLTSRARVVGGAFVVAALVALYFGVLLVPGGVLLLFLLYEVRPPRGVAMTDRGVGAMSHTFWSSRPKAWLGDLVDVGQAIGPQPSDAIQVGAERITLSAKERARFEGLVPR